MKTDDRSTLPLHTYPRRNVLRAGMGVASLTASGLIGAKDVAGMMQESAEGTPIADMAEEQVLRIQSGSGGGTSFELQPMAGGNDMEAVQALWFLPPMYFDIDLNLQPLIIDSWNNNEDFTVWTFTIDPRAQWSDGTPITATQIKGTWELMGDPLVGHPRIQNYMGQVIGFQDVLDLVTTEASGLVVIDESTLEVQLTTSDPIFHWRIATVHLSPVKVEDARNDPQFFWTPENNPACSGPYRLESWDPDGGTAVMGKSPNWWLGEGQHLDRIELLFVNDVGTIALMLRNGEVDMAQPGQVLPAELEAEFPDLFRPVIGFGYDSLWLTEAEPTNDINVRKALILSVDQEAVFQAAFPLGTGVPTDQLLDPDLPCREEEIGWYPYDPEAAKAALAESSYGSAENLPTLRVTPRGERPQNVRALETVIEFWRQNLGITNIVFEEAPEGFGPEEELINITRDDVLTRFPDAATYMLVGAHSSSTIPIEFRGGYKNDEVDALIDQALVVSPEDPARCELALEAQRLFLDDYPVVLFGAEKQSLNAREYVRNYKRGPDRTFIEPWDVYIATH